MAIDFEKQALRIWTAHGLLCATVRAPLYGAINGYVQVPETHPAHGRSYSDELFDGVRVNGGLTYGDENGWFGFDTLHAWDLDEVLGASLSTESCRSRWTPRMVEREIESLAQQLAKLGGAK